LNDCWQVFSPKDGAVVKRPSQSTVREIINEWDRLVKSDECHFLIGAQLRYLCKPPYGANIASAGLLLGTFIAPRMDKLIVLKNGNQYAISQWLHDGIFKGKFLDCEGLDNIRLAYLGEVASEWTSLFDEWDQAESYLDRHNIYARADELKCRIPIPPIENYRFELLEREGVDAGQWLRRTRNDQDEALSKIARGAETADLGLISWGASRLLAIADNMRLHTPRWTKEQIEEFDSEVVNAKQQIIQDFSTWLRKQSLNSTNPALVGDFKHRMMSLVGGNLIKLDLKTQYDELEKHVNALVRDSETAAASSQLIRDVRSWLQLTRGALRIIRVAEIRGLIDVCKNFKAQLQDMAKRTKLIDLTSVDGELTGFQTKLDGALSEAMDRGSRIWDSEIRTGTDIHMLVQEVNVLTSMFEGCDTDLCDLRAMADVLTDYERTYRQLQEDTLTLDELNRIVTRAKENIKSTYKDASIPWDIDGTFTALITDIEAYRSNRSHQWIKDMESELNPMDGMPVGEANRLFDRASNPPAYLTDQDAKRLVQMKSRIEHRLNSLVMEWLIQKFMELPMPEKKRFLKLAKEKLVE